MTQVGGTVTYCCSYAAKAEEPDHNLMYKLLGKTLGNMVDKPTTRDIYRTLLNSLMGATKVPFTVVNYIKLPLHHI